MVCPVHTGLQASSGGVNSTNHNATFPEDGSEPSDIHTTLGVAEGELRFAGHGNSRARVLGVTMVGLPTSSGTGGQTLTLDNVFFDCTEANYVYNGWQNSSKLKNQHSVIKIINGARLAVKATMPGYSCSDANSSIVYAITNGTYSFSSSGGGYLSRGYAGTGTRAIVRYHLNASQLYTTEKANLDGSLELDLDNGSTFSTEDGKPVSFNKGNDNRLYGEILVRGGSTFMFSGIDEPAQNRDFTIAFDNGKWVYDANNGDKTYPASQNGHVIYEMRGRGVILSPSAGCTFTTMAPFIGKGGVVNAGLGTIAFADGTALFKGTVEAISEASTVDFSNCNQTLEGNGFKGAGTIKGATIYKAKLPVEFDDTLNAGEGAVNFEDCALSGLITVNAGRTLENPLPRIPLPKPIAVAKISGSTTIDVSKFRLKGTGQKNIAGVFELKNGTIYLNEIITAGAIITIR